MRSSRTDHAPRRLAGSVAGSQAEAGTALVYGIDMDPRWVKRALRTGRPLPQITTRPLAA